MRNRILLLSLSLVLISACGTRDYEDPELLQMRGPSRDDPYRREPHVVQVTTEAAEGYLWDFLQWGEVSTNQIDQMKSLLRDDFRLNTFAAFGTAAVGGAVVGILIRASGSWFLGPPVESEIGHPFWKRADEIAKVAGQGLVRGALFSTGCYLALVGVNPLPYDGILGDNYKNISASTAVGLAAAIAAAKPTMDFMRGRWLGDDSRLTHLLNRYDWSRKATESLGEWTNNTTIGNGVRYRLFPGLILVGVGAGVGLIVYDSLTAN